MYYVTDRYYKVGVSEPDDVRLLHLLVGVAVSL